MSLRAFKFKLLEKVILPICFLPLKWWIKSWRVEDTQQELLTEASQVPHMIVATYHGMLMQLLAYQPLFERYGRKLVVMASPSRDGRLMASLLDRYGIANVPCSSRSRSIAGSMGFVRELRKGFIGLIAVDGPRGPACEVKQGIVRIAEAADARILIAIATASSGKSFKSWDHAHMPWPFAKVSVEFRLLDDMEGLDTEARIARVQAEMLEIARRRKAPVLPPELVNP